ncbi:43966_t:CDS:2, partial [Gigaspora margarita]
SNERLFGLVETGLFEQINLFTNAKSFEIENTNLRLKNNVLGTEITNLESKNAMLQEAHSNLLSKHATLESEHVNLKFKPFRASKNKNGSQLKYSVLQKELAKFQHEKVKNEEEIKKLKIEINDTITTRNQVESNLLLTIDELRKEKQEKNRKIDELNKKIEELNKKIDDLKDEKVNNAVEQMKKRCK